MASLLDHVLSFVMSEAKSLIDARLSNEAKPVKEAAAPTSLAAAAASLLNEKKDSNEERGIGAPLREFLARSTICIVGRADASKADFEFALAHALRVIQASEKLVTHTINKLGAPKDTKLGVLSFVSDILRQTVGTLLSPLFAGLRNVKLDLGQACKVRFASCYSIQCVLHIQMLGSLYKLLASVDNLASRMPDVIAKERTFVKGESTRIVVTRTATVETTHPVRSGTTSKTLSIPGVSEMAIEFDPKTFRSMTAGSLVTLYKGAVFR